MEYLTSVSAPPEPAEGSAEPTNANELATIILPTYGLPQYTLACLGSLTRCTEYQPVELIWVDNGSEWGQQQVVRTYLEAGSPIPWRVITLKENRGWVGGCLAGYEALAPETRWVVLLNNDTVVSVGWLTRMIRALESNPDWGIMGCVSAGGGGWQDMGRLQGRGWIVKDIVPPATPDDLDQVAQQLAARYQGQVREAPMVSFFAVVLRRRMLEEIGFLDSRFGLGLGDDDDLCRRARYHGWRVGLALEVLIWHWRRTTFKALALEGRDWRAMQQANIEYLEWKGQNMYKELTYLGDPKTGYPYIMSVPARDLYGDDLVALEGMGITKKSLIQSGLYVDSSFVEVEPFCGAPTEEGAPCRRTVERWGMRCWQHRETIETIEEVDDGS